MPPHPKDNCPELNETDDGDSIRSGSTAQNDSDRVTEYEGGSSKKIAAAKIKVRYGQRGDESHVSEVTAKWDVVLPEHPLNEEAQQVVGQDARYRIEKTLGKGGMGEVLLATDLRLSRKVAIKRILKSHNLNEFLEERFLTEARSIAALNHPNIVQIYDYGREKDGPFLIMEYVEGTTLAEKCRKRPIELEEAIDLTCQLCDGLAKAHAASIIHRDIKPANVLLTTNGVPKLTDFGLAKDLSSEIDKTMTGMVLGTLDYMPPEQRLDAKLTDHRSDLWSLAASLYQMVTGERPNVIRIASAPSKLQHVLDQALHESREARYQSAIELRDALRDCLKTNSSYFSALDQGQCPNCLTNNDSSRRFCRNPDCAASLEVGCLSCSSTIAIWELVCRDCGAKQQELLARRREEMTRRRMDAELSIPEHQYSQAILIADQLGGETDPRLQHLKDWSEQFIEDVKQARAREFQRAGELLDESSKHETAYDFSAGIKALQQIPVALHKEEIPGQAATVAAVLDRLCKKQSEYERLMTLTRSRLKSGKVHDLLGVVERLLQLVPNRDDLAKLKAQLLSRQKKQSEQIESVLAAARQLRGECQFQRAIDTLNRIPEILRSDEIKALASELASLAQKRAHAMNVLTRAEETKSYANGLKESLPYQSVLQQDPTVEDAEYNALHRRIVAHQQQQQKEHRALKLQRASRKKMRLGISVAIASVLVLIAGLWAQSAIRSARLSSALAEERWEEVLSIDSENLPALIGRANARITGTDQDLDWLLLEVERIKTIDPAHPAVSQFTGLVYALQSVEASKSGEISKAERKLRDAKGLSVDVSYIHRASKALAFAYARRADGMLASGDAEGALHAIEKAKSFDSQITISGDLAIAEAQMRASELVQAYEMKADDASEQAASDALNALKELNEQSSVLKRLEAKMMLVKISAAETLANQRVESYELDPIQSNYQEAEEAFLQLENLDPQSSVLTKLRLTLLSIATAEAESLLGEQIEAYRLEPTRLNLDKAMSDLLALENLNPKSAGLNAFRSTLQAMATSQALVDADSMVAAYEKDPTSTGLENALSAVDTAITLASNPDEPALVELRSRLAKVLLVSIEKFEAERSDENLENARTAANQIEKKLRLEPLASTANARIAEALLARMREIPVDQAIDEMQLFRTLNAMEKLETAERVLIRMIFPAFRASLRKANYDAASKYYSELVDRDPEEANKLVADWLDIPIKEYDKLPATLFSQLPPEELRSFSFSKLNKLSHEAIGALPTVENSVGMELKLIPAGTFIMGDNRFSESSPEHQVNLSRPFLIGAYEVTRLQYAQVMGTQPSGAEAPQKPVEFVSWEDANAFCNKLSELPTEQSMQRVYRLPTEAEWEYACRAGTTTKYGFGEDVTKLSQYAWYRDNSEGESHPVGGKLPNRWGLYDMTGNLAEWCSDWRKFYVAELAIDPKGPNSGSSYIHRGGDWTRGPQDCESAHRGWGEPQYRNYNMVGFRVCCTISATQ